MKPALRAFLCVLLTSAVFTACKKETETYSDDSRAYFPLRQGHYVVYETDSTIWDDFTRTVSRVHAQLRYTIADSFRDLNNDMAYNVIVDARPADSVAWTRHSALYVTATAGGVDYVENNLRFRKLVFPVREGLSWDGNRQIATNQTELQYFSGWQYQYENVGQPYNNGRRSFDQTVSVPQADATTGNDTLYPQDYADRTFAKEVYAREVGLVYRELEHWVYDRSVSQQYFRKGFAVKMRAIDHN